jgi:hypothetical protein
VPVCNTVLSLSPLGSSTLLARQPSEHTLLGAITANFDCSLPSIVQATDGPLPSFSMKRHLGASVMQAQSCGPGMSQATVCALLGTNFVPPDGSRYIGEQVGWPALHALEFPQPHDDRLLMGNGIWSRSRDDANKHAQCVADDVLNIGEADLEAVYNEMQKPTGQAGNGDLPFECRSVRLLKLAVRANLFPTWLSEGHIMLFKCSRTWKDTHAVRAEYKCSSPGFAAPDKRCIKWRARDHPNEAPLQCTNNLCCGQFVLYIGSRDNLNRCEALRGKWRLEVKWGVRDMNGKDFKGCVHACDRLGWPLLTNGPHSSTNIGPHAFGIEINPHDPYTTYSSHLAETPPAQMANVEKCCCYASQSMYYLV